jgi:hypothetical protein
MAGKFPLQRLWQQRISMQDLWSSRRWLRRMPYSGMWRRVALVRTDVSEEGITSVIRVERVLQLLLAAYAVLSSLTFQTDDGGDTIFRKVGSFNRHTESSPEDGILQHVSCAKQETSKWKHGLIWNWGPANLTLTIDDYYWKLNDLIWSLVYNERTVLYSCCLVIFLHPVARSITQSFSSVFVRHYQIFWVAVGLERGPLSPCESKWGATWKKSSGSGLENW